MEHMRTPDVVCNRRGRADQPRSHHAIGTALSVQLEQEHDIDSQGFAGTTGCTHVVILCTGRVPVKPFFIFPVMYDFA